MRSTFTEAVLSKESFAFLDIILACGWCLD